MKKIAIFGVPRSGTSWLSQIFNSHPDVVMRFQPLFSYEHKGRLSEHSSSKEIAGFFEEILNSQDKFALMTADTHKNYPNFVKSPEFTHIAFKETRYLHIVENMLNKTADVIIIGIVRNPLATLASWIKAPKEFNPDWDIHREWRSAPSKNQNKSEEFYGFNRWKEVAENFIRFESKYSKQFKIVRYDQLKASPKEITEEIFEFCNLHLHIQVKEFLAASQSVHDDDPYSVFRSKANDDSWRNVLPEDIVDEVRLELSNSPLRTFLAENE